MLQCVGVCYSNVFRENVLQCVVVSCHVLQCVDAALLLRERVAASYSVLQYVIVCCKVL